MNKEVRIEEKILKRAALPRAALLISVIDVLVI